ncbi:unnamed protein product [Porites evermanni]|uniref:Ion transport domain-containing protein n=1 Tax=Porites evermanni TaxID=104178 RepID=A0ABN8QHR3_9CNID|nr:unnamed protein product [Porites evermanni]
MSVRGPYNVGRAVPTDPTLVRYVSAITEQKKCWDWWKITTHLGWSLLDLSEGLSTLESSDSYSETLARLLFAAYLVFALILLINMLIALLSNTYQRVQRFSVYFQKSNFLGEGTNQDNSRNEWVFKRAIAIQTFRNYYHIPVPWNIFCFPTECIHNFCTRTKAVEPEEINESTDSLDQVSC